MYLCLKCENVFLSAGEYATARAASAAGTIMVWFSLLIYLYFKS